MRVFDFVHNKHAYVHIPRSPALIFRSVAQRFGFEEYDAPQLESEVGLPSPSTPLSLSTAAVTITVTVTVCRSCTCARPARR